MFVFASIRHVNWMLLQYKELFVFSKTPRQTFTLCLFHIEVADEIYLFLEKNCLTVP